MKVKIGNEAGTTAGKSEPVQKVHKTQKAAKAEAGARSGEVITGRAAVMNQVVVEMPIVGRVIVHQSGSVGLIAPCNTGLITQDPEKL